MSNSKKLKTSVYISETYVHSPSYRIVLSKDKKSRKRNTKHIKKEEIKFSLYRVNKIMYRENPKGSKKDNPLAFINKFIKFVGKKSL